MRISDEIREYANKHQIDEWSVFELAYLNAFGHYDEKRINTAYRQWFHKGAIDGHVEWWVTDFLRKRESLWA